jgi:hypothetical protein
LNTFWSTVHLGTWYNFSRLSNLLFPATHAKNSQRAQGEVIRGPGVFVQGSWSRFSSLASRLSNLKSKFFCFPQSTQRIRKDRDERFVCTYIQFVQKNLVVFLHLGTWYLVLSTNFYQISPLASRFSPLTSRLSPLKSKISNLKSKFFCFPQRTQSIRKERKGRVVCTYIQFVQKNLVVFLHLGTWYLVLSTNFYQISHLASRLSLLASHFSPLASHLSPLASRLSLLVSHLSLLASHLSPLASRLSLLKEDLRG